MVWLGCADNFCLLAASTNMYSNHERINRLNAFRNQAILQLKRTQNAYVARVKYILTRYYTIHVKLYSYHIIVIFE